MGYNNTSEKPKLIIAESRDLATGFMKRTKYRTDWTLGETIIRSPDGRIQSQSGFKELNWDKDSKKLYD